MGPRQYVQHLTSGLRLPFTAAYFGSIALTIFFAVGVSESLDVTALVGNYLKSYCGCPRSCSHQILYLRRCSDAAAYCLSLSLSPWHAVFAEHKAPLN